MTRRAALLVGGGGSFTPPAPTSVAEDGARVSLFTRANTYTNGLVNVSGTLLLFTTESPSTEHAAGSGAYLRTSTDAYASRTLLYAGSGAGRHGNIEAAFRTSTGRILVALDDQGDSNPFDVVPNVIYSDDGGASWSSPYVVSNTFSGDCVTGEFAELPDGTIILALYGEQTGIVGGNTFAKVVFSSDDGATFGSETTMASSASRTYQEPNIVWVNGQLVTLMRSDTNQHTWRTTSPDGTTWSAPGDVLVMSGPPDFLEWWPGYLFCMARNDNSQFRPRYALSFDSGATWGSVTEVDTGETRELDGTAMCFTDATHFTTIYALANSGSSSTVYLRQWVVS